MQGLKQGSAVGRVQKQWKLAASQMPAWMIFFNQAKTVSYEINKPKDELKYSSEDPAKTRTCCRPSTAFAASITPQLRAMAASRGTPNASTQPARPPHLMSGIVQSNFHLFIMGTYMSAG
jgi:hypothetical protein